MADQLQEEQLIDNQPSDKQAMEELPHPSLPARWDRLGCWIMGSLAMLFLLAVLIYAVFGALRSSQQPESANPNLPGQVEED